MPPLLTHISSLAEENRAAHTGWCERESEKAAHTVTLFFFSRVPFVYQTSEGGRWLLVSGEEEAGRGGVGGNRGEAEGLGSALSTPICWLCALAPVTSCLRLTFHRTQVAGCHGASPLTALTSSIFSFPPSSLWSLLPSLSHPKCGSVSSRKAVPTQRSLALLMNSVDDIILVTKDTSCSFNKKNTHTMILIQNFMDWKMGNYCM